MARKTPFSELHVPQNGIPGVPNNLDLGYMKISSTDHKTLQHVEGDIGHVPPDVSAAQNIYFEGFSPLVCGALFISLLIVSLVVGLTVNYKVRKWLSKATGESRDKAGIGELADVELGLSGNECVNNDFMGGNDAENAKIQAKIDCINASDHVMKHAAGNNCDPASKCDTIKRSDHLPKSAAGKNWNSGIKRTLCLPQTLISNKQPESIKNNQHFGRTTNIYLPNQTPCNADAVYTLSEMNNCYHMCTLQKNICSETHNQLPHVSIPQQKFDDPERIATVTRNIRVMFHATKFFPNSNHVDILIFLLCTVFSGAEENCYMFHPELCQIMETQFFNGTLLKHLLLVENTVLKECFVNCLVNYFTAHWSYPLFGHTSYIAFRFHSMENMDLSPCYFTHVEILNMALLLHINFEEKDSSKDGGNHVTYLLQKVTLFLEGCTSNLGNDSDDTDMIVLKLIQCIHLVFKSSPKKTFIYLQNILRIYNQHAVCCLKKKNNLHISQSTDEKLFQILGLVLDHGRLNSYTIKLMQAVALLFGNENCSPQFLAKLDRAVNKENIRTGKDGPTGRAARTAFPVNIDPGSWN